MKDRQRFMRRCFQLALNGRGSTAPNPVVGAILVHKGKIIGEGWHRRAGLPHAEPVAIESVHDQSLLREATLYVNLEPCSHHGRTPACSRLIIDKQIPEVVVSNLDPNPLVSGSGLEMLRRAGVKVTSGILEKDGRELNRFFFHYHERKRPYIVLKWAQSADGFMAPAGGKDYWITNPYSRQRVHQWRSEIQAILIGKNTLLADDPLLDSRFWNGRNPVPVILGDPSGDNFRVFWRERPVFVFGAQKDQPEMLRFSSRDLQEILQVLYEHEIQSVLVEGGAAVLQSFIKADLWDEARIFTSPVKFGQGMRAPVPHRAVWLKTENIEGDKLDWFYHSSNDYIHHGRYL